MAKTNIGLVAWCKAMLGHPYWYGTFCQIPTMDLYNKVSTRKANAKYYTSKRKPQYMANIEAKKSVTDCVGMIKGYCWAANDKSLVYSSQYYGKTCPDTSADGMLAACKEKGKIGTMPDVPGMLVFMTGHVGVYIGGGKVIEARGFDYGVVLTELKGRPWKSWGKCPYITYNAVTAPTVPMQAVKVKPKKYTVICDTVRVRKGAGITYPTVRYLRKGAVVSVTEVKNNWGKIGNNEWITVKPSYVKEVK